MEFLLEIIFEFYLELMALIIPEDKVVSKKYKALAIIFAVIMICVNIGLFIWGLVLIEKKHYIGILPILISVGLSLGQIILGFVSDSRLSNKEKSDMKQKYDVAAYIWPAYTGDELRTRMFWGEGMGEWQSVKNSAPKENGYYWDRKPLWGYKNEADPSVMQQQIKEAKDHGVNVFIYDWYWYDNRPFLENCLNDGFLKAENCEDMQFYLMWANHDANNYWHIDLSDDYGDTVIWNGSVSRATFETVVNRIIEKYFSRPNYYKINGCPVFMIYDLNNLVSGLGGLDKTKDAIEYFRERTRAAGFPNLHLQFTIWGENTVNLSGFDSNMQGSTKEMVSLLGADSVSHYQFVHFTSIDRDYNEIVADVIKEWERIDREYTVPYFPHISLGWDNNPRFRRFRHGIVKNNTPENVRRALECAKKYIDEHPNLPAPLVTVNSWNEWTETSYLQPDNVYGYGYLDAVKSVFLEE